MLHGTTSYAEDARQPPPPIPPSPTLSNPDMILPFDPNERQSSTPSPPFNLPSLSHLQSFYDNRPPPNDYTGASGAPAPVNRPPKKGFPRHTWLHEGHDAASRRLSDIGEEDSSSPARPGGIPRNLQVFSSREGGRMTGSPVPHRVVEDMENRETGGAWSSSSSSTVSGGASESSSEGTRARHVGQGVPQESRSMDQVSEAVRAIKTGTNGDESRIGEVSTTQQEGGVADELSSVILSSEAERILENAKKRLTLMEGNLSRARTSVRVSPSLSASPTSSPSGGQGLGQPVGGLYQSISRADRRASAMRPRPTYTSSQDASNNGHSRVYSETNLPSASFPAAEPSLSRSLSAMGSSTASNFHNDERSFRYEPTRAYLTHRASVSAMQPLIHSPLATPEEDAEPEEDEPRGLGISTEEYEKADSGDDDEFDSTHVTYDPPSRSQSQLQVRDLQDQMKGLHIKISSLKVKTQEDNLRRRSLQSLRTPSPFTAADHWYNSSMELKERHSHSPLNPNGGRVRSPEYQRESRYSSDESAGEGNGAVNGHYESKKSNVKHGSTEEDEQSTNASLYQDAEEGDYDTDGSSNSSIDRDALNEILREPMDDDLDDSLEAFPAAPRGDSTAHEDREDAFDYENFILHSALGNYTQSRLRRPSNVSTSSVETTRPANDVRSVRHSRANSGASVSTVATFATATEGDPDDFEGVLYWDRRFNDELRQRHYPSHGGSHHQEPDSENMGTPRAIQRQNSHRSAMNNSDGHVVYDRYSMSQRSDSTTTGSATPTALASSLVSTVRAASSPHPNSEGNSNMGLNDDDTRLLENLFQSLGDVCMDLQSITTSPDPDAKQVRLLRWRLDAARRVLDGQLDT